MGADTGNGSGDKVEDRPPDDLSEIGRRLSAARRIVDSTCAWCGQPITGTAKRKYCSASHSVLAYRRRKKEREADGGGRGKEEASR